MLHLGYFLLLDKVDAGDGKRILKRAKELGIKTSIDLVSENSTRYHIVKDCLPYVDNVIINEHEAGMIADIEPKPENLEEIARKIKSMGVSERVIIHMPEISVSLSDKGYIEFPSWKLPSGTIKGKTGAGDAFCAGVVSSLTYGKTLAEAVEVGSILAASVITSSENVCPRFQPAELGLPEIE